MGKNKETVPAPGVPEEKPVKEPVAMGAKPEEKAGYIIEKVQNPAYLEAVNTLIDIAGMDAKEAIKAVSFKYASEIWVQRKVSYSQSNCSEALNALARYGKAMEKIGFPEKDIYSEVIRGVRALKLPGPYGLRPTLTKEGIPQIYEGKEVMRFFPIEPVRAITRDDKGVPVLDEKGEKRTHQIDNSAVTASEVLAKAKASAFVGIFGP